MYLNNMKYVMNRTLVYLYYLTYNIKHRIFLVGNLIWILLHAKSKKLIKEYRCHYQLDYLINSNIIINRLDIYSKNIIYYFTDVFNQGLINYLKLKIYSN